MADDLMVDGVNLTRSTGTTTDDYGYDTPTTYKELADDIEELQDDVTEINSNLSNLNNNLTNSNNEIFKFGYQDGKRGYIVNVEGADTFFPFKSEPKITYKSITGTVKQINAKIGDVIVICYLNEIARTSTPTISGATILSSSNFYFNVGSVSRAWCGVTIKATNTTITFTNKNVTDSTYNTVIYAMVE